MGSAAALDAQTHYSKKGRKKRRKKKNYVGSDRTDVSLPSSDFLKQSSLNLVAKRSATDRVASLLSNKKPFLKVCSICQDVLLLASPSSSFVTVGTKTCPVGVTGSFVINTHPNLFTKPTTYCIYNIMTKKDQIMLSSTIPHIKTVCVCVLKSGDQKHQAVVVDMDSA